MNCEVCGVEIKGKSHRVLIERSDLNVCDGCSQYGGGVLKSPRAKTSEGCLLKKALRKGAFDYNSRRYSIYDTNKSRMIAPAPRIKIKTRRQGDIYSQIKDEVVQDYHEIVRGARQARGWTHEKLADSINERASLIKKIEKGDMLPDERVRKKLERILDIRLVENVEK